MQWIRRWNNRIVGSRPTVANMLCPWVRHLTISTFFYPGVIGYWLMLGLNTCEKWQTHFGKNCESDDLSLLCNEKRWEVWVENCSADEVPLWEGKLISHKINTWLSHITCNIFGLSPRMTMMLPSAAQGDMLQDAAIRQKNTLLCCPQVRFFNFGSVGRSEFYIFIFLRTRYCWGPEFGSSTNDLY